MTDAEGRNFECVAHRNVVAPHCPICMLIERDALRRWVSALSARADALDRLEAWLRVADWRMVESSAVVGEGEVQVTLMEGCADPDGATTVAGEARDTLADAINAALDAAGGKK